MGYKMNLVSKIIQKYETLNCYFVDICKNLIFKVTEREHATSQSKLYCYVRSCVISNQYIVVHLLITIYFLLTLARQLDKNLIRHPYESSEF